MANVVVRGVSAQAWQVRANLKVVEGRRPASGQERGLRRRPKLVGRFPNTGVGQIDALRRAALGGGVPLHGRRLGVRVGDLGRERAGDAGVARGRCSSRSSFRLADPGGVRGGQAGPRGRQAAHGGRAPGVGLLRPAVPAAGQHPPDPRDPDHRRSWRWARSSARSTRCTRRCRRGCRRSRCC